MKILFLAKAPDATAHYRCHLPALSLRRAGHEVRESYLDPVPLIKHPGVSNADVAWADVVVFQRPLTDFALEVANGIKTKGPEKILVADYDDDYFAVPSWNPGYVFVRSHQEYWPEIPKLMDGVMVSTHPLREALEKHVPCPVQVIENGFDFEEFDKLGFMPDVDLLSPKLLPDKQMGTNYSLKIDQFNDMARDRVVCAWAGSRFHYLDLDWLPDEMNSVCKMVDDVIFLFIGYMQGNLIPCVPTNRLFVTGGRAPVSAFYSLLKSLKIDIMLAPLHPCEFNSSKSALKAMEAMALGAYPVCAEWEPYEHILQDGFPGAERVGRLAGYGKGEWARAILAARDVVRSPDQRDAARKTNQSFIRQHYDVLKRADQYVEFFSRLMAVKREVAR